MASAPISFATVRRLALKLPGVQEGTWYGTAGFRVGRKYFVRLREDAETLAVRCEFDEREARMAAAPMAFFITEHYREYPAVCVRLSAVKVKDLQSVLESAWRREAGKKLAVAQQPKSPSRPAKKPKR